MLLHKPWKLGSWETALGIKPQSTAKYTPTLLGKLHTALCRGLCVSHSHYLAGLCYEGLCAVKQM